MALARSKACVIPASLLSEMCVHALVQASRQIDREKRERQRESPLQARPYDGKLD
jgi:hypothetical protein